MIISCFFDSFCTCFQYGAFFIEDLTADISALPDMSIPHYTKTYLLVQKRDLDQDLDQHQGQKSNQELDPEVEPQEELDQEPDQEPEQEQESNHLEAGAA